ncbi:unnamed protein product [Strongylus vulgaris]|uniref:Uncharacterized protein n=1 Tax=Strongylus vulgaris TaxID=40348 RepID=A0A3P7JJH3_STRVU|nr:unnamed protein product [Strongylus vulgaris]
MDGLCQNPSFAQAGYQEERATMPRVMLFRLNR